MIGGNRGRHGYHRALNVAEKPSVAKGAANILSGGNCAKFAGLSQYNPNYRFDYTLHNGMTYDMIFTSVRGHIMYYDVPKEYKKWDLATNQALYAINLEHNVNKDVTQIVENIKSLLRKEAIDTLILWLDCDREGENIAFEVIEVVKEVVPNINILRAHFSALTPRDLENAMNGLTPPDKNLSDAVDIRQKIDLIIGASFTRFQTLAFKDILFPNEKGSNNRRIISYGPCQFPTMNFVLERAQRILTFQPEKFYYIDLDILKKDDYGQELTVKFKWNELRFFDLAVTLATYERCVFYKVCTITKVEKTPKTKYRPIPLNTVEFTKLASKKLRIDSSEAMEIAEKLYQKGLISYPRTETQKYSDTQLSELKKIVEDFQASNTVGDYCRKLLDDTVQQSRYTLPKKGNGDDQAHPPIHPVKYDAGTDLTDKEKKIYDLIIRHFLATLSPDAKGTGTSVELECGGEFFHAEGLVITDLGYLEVYVYEKWKADYLPNFTVGETIPEPNSLLMLEGTTTPPNFLTEAELIGLMDKSGIGTDATIAEHIKTVTQRGYIKKCGNYFKPTLIGAALRFSYMNIKIDIYKPFLRAQMEKQITEVAQGTKQKDEVYKLYKLIWSRFMASQMTPAKVETNSVEIEAEDYTFRMSASKVNFNGFLIVYDDREENEQDGSIPTFNEGDVLNLKKIV